VAGAPQKCHKLVAKGELGTIADMTSLELRASLSLAFLYALRLLGLFLILPVFAEHAKVMPGGTDAALVGLALGAYGLTQGLLQIPFGLASDYFGRKKIIGLGLLIFAAGSLVAAIATTVEGVTIGRALQGAGAVSGAITALLADATREEQRTKATALIGASIRLTFALSLILSPLLYASFALAGLFYVTAGLIVVGLIVLWLVVPNVSAPTPKPFTWAVFKATALEPDLLRLNFGNFVLQAVLMSIFVVMPRWLATKAGLTLTAHWQVYLPVVVASLLLTVPPLMWSERRHKLKALFVGSIAFLVLVSLGFALQPSSLTLLAILLLAFFLGFNVLEASLPSLVSRLAPAANKGLALGIYNTLQALGLFTGAALGGWLASHWGDAAVFYAAALALLVWLGFAPSMKRWPTRKEVKVDAAQVATVSTPTVASP
jgi:MFS family permease